MSERPFKFSILQLIGITAAVGGVIALHRVLVSPPLGSSGLEYAWVPALVILIGLWLGVRGFQRRMAAYAVVGALLSLLFFAKYLWKTDWMFGHHQGPLQYEIASAYLAGIALVANIGWWIGAIVSWTRVKPTAAADDARPGMKRAIAGAIGMAILLLFTGLLALASGPDLPRAMARLDRDVQHRVLQQPRPVRETAELVARADNPVRREMAMKMQSRYPDPADASTLPTLAKLLADNDSTVRRAAALSIYNLAQSSYVNSVRPGAGPQPAATQDPEVLAHIAAALNDEDAMTRMHIVRAIRTHDFLPPPAFANTAKSAVPALVDATSKPQVEVRGMAVMILGAMGNNAAEAVPTLIAIVDNPDAGCIMPALQALGQIDAEAKTIVPFLADKIANSPTPSVRSFAARSLGDLGPAAKDALPAFKIARDKRYLSLQDAQAIYEIDPATAEEMRIPKRPPIPRQPPILGSDAPR